MNTLAARLTAKAITVLTLANNVANAWGTTDPNLIHVLIGITNERSNIAAKTLLLAGLDHEQIKTKAPPAAISCTKNASSLIDNAGEQAKIIANDFIGPEHLLLAILECAEGQTLIERLGRSPIRLKATLLRLLGLPYVAVGKPYGISQDSPMQECP
jgi:ATP-dependent Clp protease ATP-binding subunit ClpC